MGGIQKMTYHDRGWGGLRRPQRVWRNLWTAPYVRKHTATDSRQTGGRMGTSKYKGACTSKKGTWAIAVSRKKIWNKHYLPDWGSGYGWGGKLKSKSTYPQVALEAWAELGNIRDQVKVKGRFHSKMKIYGNVELCLQKLPITLILLKNFLFLLAGFPGIFDPSAVL